jgi:predicted MFS family arabinose efflux permease
MKVLVSEWFEKRQGFAIGVALMGTSTAGVIVPLLTTRLSEAVGWRLTGALMSLAIWLVALPFFLWKAKDFPRGLGDVAHSVAGEAPAPARAPDLRGLRLSPTFWVLCAVFFLIGMVDHAMAAHLPIFFNKEAGLGPHVAALGFSLIMLMSNVGKVGYGWLFDRLSMRGAAICWMVAAAGILLTFPIGAALTMCIFAVVYGPTQGGMLVSVPVLAKHAFGPQALAKTVAIFSTVFMIGSAVGPALAGYMFDHYGNYDLAFGVMAASAALAGLLVLLARRRPMLESLAQADHLAPTGPQSAQA